jgi:hypothetical protein
MTFERGLQLILTIALIILVVLAIFWLWRVL